MSWIVERVRPTNRDIAFVAENMRDIDKKEVFEMYGIDPLSALKGSVDGSRRVVATRFNGTPNAIFGVADANLATGHGVPWVLTTDACVSMPGVFMRMSFDIYEPLTRGYKVLTNYVLEDNIKSIEWLKLLGFTVEPPQPIGWRGANFRRFVKEK